MKKFIAILVAAFLILSFGMVQAQPDQMIDTSATNQYAKVYFEKGSDVIARLCVNITNEHVAWIEDTKGIPLEQIPIPIFLYSNRQDFKQCQILDVRGAEGVTILWYPKIVIYFNGSYRDLKHVLTHELNHFVTLDYITRNYKDCVKEMKHESVVINIKYGPDPYFTELQESSKQFDIFKSGNLPLAIMEGIAEAWSNPHKVQMHALIRDYVIWGYPLNIWDLDRTRSFLSIYKLGESLVEYIERECGPYAMKTFFDHACSENISKAISYLFGWDEKHALQTLNKQWRSYLFKRYQIDKNAIQLYNNPDSTSNIGTACWAPLSENITYTWKESQVRIADRHNVYVSDCNRHVNSLGILKKNAIIEGDYLIYASAKDKSDYITIYDLKNKKEIAKDRFENIANITSPVYKDGTTVFIGQDVNGFKNICIKPGNYFYRVLNSHCDIQSLVTYERFVYFIGDYEERGVYDIYAYMKNNGKVARLTWGVNARDLALIEGGAGLYFIINGTEYNYAAAYDLDTQILYISQPIVEYIQFPFLTKNGDLIATMYANGRYRNFEITASTTHIMPSPVQWATSWKYSSKDHEIKKAKFKWNISLEPVTVAYSTYFGAQGSMALAWVREDGARKWLFAASENGIGLLTSWHKPWLTKFTMFQWYNIYKFYTTRRVIRERSVDIVGGLLFKTSEYSQTYVSIGAGNRRRALYMTWSDSHYGGLHFKYPGKYEYTQSYFPTFSSSNSLNRDDYGYQRFSRGWVSNINAQYYYDDTRYSRYWTPISGTKFWLSGHFDVDWSNRKIVNWKNQMMLTKYISLGEPICWATRLIGGMTLGVNPHRYELGGPTSYRGYEWMSLYTRHFWLASTDLRFPFASIAGIFNQKLEGPFLHHVKLKFFGDIGQAWDKKPDDLIWGFGFGLSGWFSYMPVQLYWVMNKNNMKFRPFLSISYDF